MMMMVMMMMMTTTTTTFCWFFSYCRYPLLLAILMQRSFYIIGATTFYTLGTLGTLLLSAVRILMHLCIMNLV
jgi:hypothetical protein